ncbi:MAG: CocE/NonD family hydrolase, partial [Anaerolineae bacterium]|nr:CocE/NonD family hydrolase [Anaerolineae bacterium]
YIPYRKNDFTALRDSIHHLYFAGHGYAAVRVDLRGSGDSDGILYDEYLPQEQLDGVEVLAWLAEQPWCTGDVGLIGISWGGFNGLQIAAHRPPHLKAVITLCSTDDRYADDVHYMGGCVLATDMLTWSSVMLAYNARPPDPDVVGQVWREQWLDRLEKTPPYIETWLNHQRRDDYWKQGSVCEDYSDITGPGFAVGCWADGYTNPTFRLLAGLTGPRLGLVGPWSHLYPEVASPGPRIGFLQECLRWWDRWLKGIDTGIMAEPMLRAWIQDSLPPRTHYADRPGHWVAEPIWPAPPANINPERLWLNQGTLDPVIRDESAQTLRGNQTHGLEAGVWWGVGQPGDWPGDQQAEDGKCLTFTTAPLEKPVEVLGFPEVTLTLAVDQPLALVAVRLCDVAPDGRSTLVSRGQLNLTHRDSHELPSALEPGRRYTVTVPLNATGHALPAGHRWRVAVSPTCWPHAWPSPQPVTLTLFTGEASFLTLPVRPPRPAEDGRVTFEAPETSPVVPHDVLRVGRRQRSIERDLISGTTCLIDFGDSGRKRLHDSGLTFDYSSTDTFSIREDDPLTAEVRCDRTVGLERGDWQVNIETSSTMSGDATHFHVTNILYAFEGAVKVFSKSWTAKIPRDMG